MSGADGAS